MTRWITAFTLPLTLVFAACDSEPVDDRAAAIEAAQAGRPPLPDQIPSMGCNIKWRAGNEPDYF